VENTQNPKEIQNREVEQNNEEDETTERKNYATGFKCDKCNSYATYATICMECIMESNIVAMNGVSAIVREGNKHILCGDPNAFKDLLYFYKQSSQSIFYSYYDELHIDNSIYIGLQENNLFKYIL